MRGWRLGGVIGFAIFALMELGDWAGLIPGYSDPGPYATLLGLTPAEESVRLISLSVLALGVVAASLATVIGLLRRTAWAEQAAFLTGGVFIVYGIYQIGAALIQLRASQTAIAIAGGIYALIGLFAIWLGRKAARAA